MKRTVAVLLCALTVISSAWAHPRHHYRLPRPPHFLAWLCIHRYEAPGAHSWHINTGNGFEGGLQFMWSTWARNGGLRFASHAYLATPLEQMWTAERAWRESGGSFAQWPNTARACGLL